MKLRLQRKKYAGAFFNANNRLINRFYLFSHIELQTWDDVFRDLMFRGREKVLKGIDLYEKLYDELNKAAHRLLQKAEEVAQQLRRRIFEEKCALRELEFQKQEVRLIFNWFHFLQLLDAGRVTNRCIWINMLLFIFIIDSWRRPVRSCSSTLGNGSRRARQRWPIKSWLSREKRRAPSAQASRMPRTHHTSDWTMNVSISTNALMALMNRLSRAGELFCDWFKRGEYKAIGHRN